MVLKQLHWWILLKEPNGPERSQLINGLERSKLVNDLERSQLMNGLERSKLVNDLERSQLMNGLERTVLPLSIFLSSTSMHYSSKAHITVVKCTLHCDLQFTLCITLCFTVVKHTLHCNACFTTVMCAFRKTFALRDNSRVLDLYEVGQSESNS